MAPDLATAWLQRGALRYERGALPQAQADLQQALTRGAPAAQAHYDLALVARAQSDASAARNHLRKALAHHPDHAEARALLARLTAQTEE